MNVHYVTDSATVSGTETILLQYVDRLRAPRYTTHLFLRDENVRLREALESRGVGFTATRSFSRRWIRTTANPTAVLHFARAFRRVARELDRVVRDRRTDLLHSFSYPASLYPTRGPAGHRRRDGSARAPGDAAALAGALDRLLGDGALRQGLGTAGRRRVEDRFALDRHLSTIEALYESNGAPREHARAR
jgi:hypothetical protein